MELFHFSDSPGIARFTPRPVRIPAGRPPAQDWPNGLLVWAVESALKAVWDCTLHASGIRLRHAEGWAT